MITVLPTLQRGHEGQAPMAGPDWHSAPALLAGLLARDGCVMSTSIRPVGAPNDVVASTPRQYDSSYAAIPVAVVIITCKVCHCGAFVLLHSL